MSRYVEFPKQISVYGKTLEGRFYGKTDFQEEVILGEIEGVPIKELKVHNHLVTLKPGEALLSGDFSYCSLLLANKNNLLYGMHLLPNLGDSTKDYITKLKQNQIVNPEKELFKKVILIGRKPDQHSVFFQEITETPIKTITLGTTDTRNFNVMIYNNPKMPGNIASFDIWFDQE